MKTEGKRRVRLQTVIRLLDEELALERFGRDPSLNGLQVEASGSVGSICLAVDACAGSIRMAARAGADLLIVHHGLLWDAREPVTGALAKRIGLLFAHRISLYAAHLPLDCHPALGNNARLARLVGIGETEPFGDYHGTQIGVCGTLPRRVPPRRLAAKLRRALGAPVRIFPFGPTEVGKLGIVSGRGASLVGAASEAGCDALLTGETEHAAYHSARELKMHLICAGHYATETLGVKALAEHLHGELGLPARFIDLPTGL